MMSPLGRASREPSPTAESISRRENRRYHFRVTRRRLAHDRESRSWSDWGAMKPIIHERDEWLAGYPLRPNEESAWWGGNTFPRFGDINNITWHYPGGSSDPDPALQLRADQASYHTRTDGGDNGRPAPFTHGYDLGYNVSIDLNGEIWKIRWTDKGCAANGGDDHGNRVSFAVQFMTAHLADDLTPAQLASARWLDGELRKMFPNVPSGVAGHRGHRDWFNTTCPGDVIYEGHVITGDLLAEAPLRSQGDEDMRYKLFKPAGFFDVLAVGPGNPFNPGSFEAAQELVDQDQVADRAGNPVSPGTDFTTVRIEISVALWTAMNNGVPPIATRA
jgi:hypothetical protein